MTTSADTVPGFRGAQRPELEQGFSIRPLGGPPLFFSRYTQKKAGLGFIEPNLLADRLMVNVELIARGATDMFEGDSHVLRPPVAPGALGLFDFRSSWSADVREPFDNLNLFMPLQAFRDFAYERGQRFVDFSYSLSSGHRDDVMHNLALAMLPALERPNEVSRLYLDHLYLAIRDHLAQSFGVFQLRPRPIQSKLTSKQLQRVMDYIDGNLAREIRLEDIATTCGLSTNTFSRGFKAAVGMSAYQWVMRRRVRAAQRAIRETQLSLSQIAQLCGFADQSHLTRTFTRFVGVSPAKWRRDLGC